MPRTLSKQAMRDVVLSANEELGIDPDFGVVFSLDVPPCADLFYTAVANDIFGIGYQHHYANEIFDESPTSGLEGVAFLNDIHYWESFPEELERAFLHELGHRWSGRVHVSGPVARALLGRDNEHWSYFLDTSSGRGVSPLEGNAWRQTGELYETTTHDRAPGFSDLDLYLMGALHSNEVAPFLIIEPDTGASQPIDCRGAIAHVASPPQHCEPASVGGSAREISILDVISAEGERIPAAVSTQRRTIAFYFLAPEGASFSQVQCEAWARRVEQLRELFSQATDERLGLENVARGEMSCAEVQALLSPSASPSQRQSRSNGCALVRGGPSRQSSLASAWMCIACAFFLRVRRGRNSGRRDKKLPG